MITSENITYRVALISRDSRKMLVTNNLGYDRVPSVCIPRWTRPARELRKAIRTSFGIDALILDLPSIDSFSECFAIAELLSPDVNSLLAPVELAAIPTSALSEERRHRLNEIMQGRTEDPFARVGWIEKAVAWLERTTGSGLSSHEPFEQYNAGRGFSLIRFCMDDGSVYWLKATAGPNLHEFAVTSVLSNLCGEYLPSLVASKKSWNAWIAAEEGRRLEALPTNPKDLLAFLRKAVDSLAAAQIRTAGRTEMLLRVGAFDQRPVTLCPRSAAFFSYLEEAMAEQRSTRVPRIDIERLRELQHIFEDSCGNLEALGLPATVIHGDLNLGNILVGASHCKFIDWAETYVGCFLVTLQHLLLLNQMPDESARDSINRDLKRRYRNALLAICEAEKIDQALIFMPLVAAFSALYARGDWLETSLRHDSRRQSYARTLARYMDRAAREPRLLSALRERHLFHSFRCHSLTPS